MAGLSIASKTMNKIIVHHKKINLYYSDWMLPLSCTISLVNRH